MAERENKMKPHKLLLPALIVIALSGLLLNACSYSVQVLTTPIASAPTATQLSVTPSVVQTEATPTLVLPLATPTLISIRADTMYMLEIFESFELGDVVRSVAFTPDGT